MASDRQQFNRAYGKWQALCDAERLSVEVTDGITAILTSDYPFNAEKDNCSDKYVSDENDWWVFEIEGKELADKLEEKGMHTELLKGATASDLDSVIADPEVTTIYTIGHGSISDIVLRGAYRGVYDWRRASEVSTHLKTGAFIQRQCGIFRRKLNVPLGLFVMHDASQVLAATGDVFDPIDLDDVQNEKIDRVFLADTPMPYEWIKEKLSKA